MPAVLSLPGWRAASYTSGRFSINNRRHLRIALVLSLTLHAFLLLLNFRLPDLDRPRAQARSLDVVLVNSKSKKRPMRAQALAQANLDGGGNTDLPQRAKSNAPALEYKGEGLHADALRQRAAQLQAVERSNRARQQQLEERRTLLLRRVGMLTSATPAGAAEPEAEAEPLRASLSISRLEAQIAREVLAYNQRPRRQFIGARTEEYRFARYVEEWRQRVERLGNRHYPDEAKGRIYGSLKLAVAINADGSVERIEVSRSSGEKILDQAAVRAVRLAAPFPPFPSDIRRDTDVLDIVRTWNYTRSDRLVAE